MLKYITLLVASLITWTVEANPLLVQPRFTSSFRFESADLWNVDIQFQGAGPVNIYLQATVTYKGALVVTARSGAFQIQPGVQSFTGVTLTTTNIQFNSQAIADIELLTGSYPAGNYTACYNAYCVSADCDGLGANALENESPQCFDFVVEPPTPILLATPEDNAELEWPRPTFNWIPPMPLSSVNGFHYLYTLVELQKDQTCNDAIIRNRPLYRKSGIEMPVQPYPAELNDLDTGKVYCWKVDGLVSEITVAQSEVWEFKIIPEPQRKFKKAIVEPCIRASLEPYHLNLTDTIAIVFSEQYNTAELTDWKISIRQEGKSEANTLDKHTLTPIFTGLGNIEVLPSGLPGMKTGIIYILEFTNLKNDTYVARIQFHKDKKSN